MVFEFLFGKKKKKQTETQTQETKKEIKKESKNSIEEKIYELQQKKAKLIDNMLSTQETFISKLTKDEIMNLFK